MYVFKVILSLSNVHHLKHMSLLKQIEYVRYCVTKQMKMPRGGGTIIILIIIEFKTLILSNT